MKLVEIEVVNPLLRAYQNVLVPGVGVDPSGRAMDPQRASVEHLVDGNNIKIILL